MLRFPRPLSLTTMRLHDSQEQRHHTRKRGQTEGGSGCGGLKFPYYKLLCMPLPLPTYRFVSLFSNRFLRSHTGPRRTPRTTPDIGYHLPNEGPALSGRSLTTLGHTAYRQAVKLADSGGSTSVPAVLAEPLMGSPHASQWLAKSLLHVSHS